MDQDQTRSIKWDFRRKLTARLKPILIVEIGVLRGNGARALLEGCATSRYIGIDPSPKPSACDLYGRGIIIAASSTSIRCCEGADLLVVDGDHTYPTILSDMRLAVSSRAVVMIDDWHYPDVRSAARAAGFTTVYAYATGNHTIGIVSPTGAIEIPTYTTIPQ